MAPRTTQKSTSKPAKTARTGTRAYKRQPAATDGRAILRFNPDRLPGQEPLCTAELTRAAIIDEIVGYLHRTPTRILVGWLGVASQHTYDEPLPRKDGA